MCLHFCSTLHIVLAHLDQTFPALGGHVRVGDRGGTCYMCLSVRNCLLNAHLYMATYTLCK
jgi:hypothetical protein